MQPHAKPILLTLLSCFTAAAIAVTLPQPINVPAHSKAHSELFTHRVTVLDFSYKRKFALKALKIKNLSAGYTGILITFVSISPTVPATVTLIRSFARSPPPAFHFWSTGFRAGGEWAA